MRKSVQILITLIWLTGTIGFSMNMHYCHDVLQQISFFSDTGACDDMETMPDEGCTDKTVQFVIDSNFNFEKYTTEINIPVIQLILNDNRILTTTLTSIIPIQYKENNFPLPDHQRIYTEVQSFLL